MMLGRIVALVFLLLLSTPTFAYANKLSDILDPEMLNVQVAYLESIAGPAMHIYPKSGGVAVRDYKVSNCHVYAYTKGTTIIGYSLILLNGCGYDFRKFTGQPSNSDNMTVGKFSQGPWYQYHVESDCIDMCGNSHDPTVDFIFQAPHALDFLLMVLTVSLSDDVSINASEKWQQAMVKSEGKAFVSNTGFNCVPKYDELALALFKDAKPYMVSVGYSPNSASNERDCRH